jgi:hypothetical protein
MFGSHSKHFLRMTRCISLCGIIRVGEICPSRSGSQASFVAASPEPFELQQHEIGRIHHAF